MNYEVSVIVSSCDADEDTWYPFFYFFKKFWKDIPVNWDIILNTESKKYCHEGINIKSIEVNNAERLAWSKRLHNILAKIDTKYILLILSDYFFYDNVDTERLLNCLAWMEKEDKIGAIYFDPNDYCEKAIINNRHTDFEKGIKGTPYMANAQIGLWRKEALYELTRYNENAWKWEYLASERTQYYNYDFYFIKKEAKKVFFYDWTADGITVYSRKWTKKCIDFFYKEGIEVDFSQRGVWEKDAPHPSPGISRIEMLLRPPMVKRISSRIKLCSNRFWKKREINR